MHIAASRWEKRVAALRSCGLDGRLRHAMRSALTGCAHAPAYGAQAVSGTVLGREWRSAWRRAVGRGRLARGWCMGRSMLGRGMQHLCAYAARAPQRIAKRRRSAAEACKLRGNPDSPWRAGTMSAKMNTHVPFPASVFRKHAPMSPFLWKSRAAGSAFPRRSGRAPSALPSARGAARPAVARLQD